MLLKLLLIIAVITIVYYMFFKKKPIQHNTKQSKDTEANEMVACSACGTYTEISESILSNNKYYCSNECVGKA